MLCFASTLQIRPSSQKHHDHLCTLQIRDGGGPNTQHLMQDQHFHFLFFIVWFCYDHPKSDDHSMNLNGKVSRLSLDEMQMNFPTRVDHHKNARNFKAT